MSESGDGIQMQGVGSAGFTLQDLSHEGVHTLVLRGEVDLLAATKLEGVVRGLCAEDLAGLVLDLRGVTFMDSSGLRATLSANALCKRIGQELSILPGPPHVHSLFEMTGLAERLPFKTDRTYVAPPSDAILPKLFAPAERHDDRRES
jgi:anti-sigma B factor antagonist